MGNLVEKAVSNGGKLAPLVISNGLHSGTGLMNPSVFIDSDGDILINLRHVNYTLCHSENTQKFPNRWGPLSYLHPETDQTLRTENYICKLNKDLSMVNFCHVKMLELHNPIWTFIGLEDARLVQWDNKYYLIGVRRDTTTHGQGRMEYSHIVINKDNWTANEIKRTRIPAPGENNSYCEKNWVPILDKPYHFIKWTSPVEIVKANPDTENCEQVSVRQGLVPPMDQRGGSQLVKWGNIYISITHDVALFKNYLQQKDAIYRHRLLVWDDQLNLVGISKQFSFLDANIEFATGAAVFEGDLLITFGFQDNAAFILRTPKLVIEDLILEALSYDL
jgi:hypothetical protein